MRRTLVVLVLLLLVILPASAQGNPNQRTLVGVPNVTYIGGVSISRGVEGLQLTLGPVAGTLNFPEGQIPFVISSMTVRITRTTGGAQIAGTFNFQSYLSLVGVPSVSFRGNVQGFVGVGYGTADEMGVVLNLSGNDGRTSLGMRFDAVLKGIDETVPFDFHVNSGVAVLTIL